MNDAFDRTTIQVRAAQAGDTAALEDLFRRYLPRIERIVAARLGRTRRDLGLDDDMVQETLLDAYLAIRDGEIRNEAGFLAWIARCVQTNIQDLVRHGRREKRREDRVQRAAADDPSFLTLSMLPGGEGTPSQVAGARELEERIEAALLRLDDRYREVLCLRVYCDMPYEQIAEAMGLRSANTANVLFLRARKELQRRLDTDQ